MSKKYIDKLKELKHRIDCQKYPSMNPDYVPMYKYTDKTANALTRCVVDWINMNGGQAERINTMGRVIDNTKIVKDVMGINRSIGSKQYIKGTGTNGSADISATIKGRSVKVEVKMKDRQSADQKKYQEHIESAGGVYWLVHSFDEFMGYYEQFINTI